MAVLPLGEGGEGARGGGPLSERLTFLGGFSGKLRAVAAPLPLPSAANETLGTRSRSRSHGLGRARARATADGQVRIADRATVSSR